MISEISSGLPIHMQLSETQDHETEHSSDLAAPVRQDRSRRSLARILASAEDILRHEGVDGFSIASIARSSGVSVGGIYARVKSKEGLLQLVKRSVTARISEGLARKLEAADPLVESIVDAYIDNLTEMFSADENIHRALFMPGVVPREASRSADARKRAGAALYASMIVGAEPRLAAFEATEVRFSAHMAVAMILSLLSPLEPVIDWEAVNRNLKRATKAYLHFLLTECD